VPAKSAMQVRGAKSESDRSDSISGRMGAMSLSSAQRSTWTDTRVWLGGGKALPYSGFEEVRSERQVMMLDQC